MVAPIAVEALVLYLKTLLINSCVGGCAGGDVGEGEHFPAFRAGSGSGEAQPVGKADRPHIHRHCAWYTCRGVR